MAINQLKVVLSILSEISKGESFPTHTDYNMDKITFIKIVKAMQEDNLISGIRFLYCDDGTNCPAEFLSEGVALTIKGMEYMNTNSTIVKTYKGLKEIRSWLPF